jgi:hypothetical protein
MKAIMRCLKHNAINNATPPSWEMMVNTMQAMRQAKIRIMAAI